MQADLTGSMESVKTAERISKAVATGLLVTAVLPASVPYLALYGISTYGATAITAAGAAATISIGTDVTKSGAALGLGIDGAVVSGSDIAKNAIEAALTAGASALFLGAIMPVIAPRVAQAVCPHDAVQNFSLWMISKPSLLGRIIPVQPAHISGFELAPIVTKGITTVFGRLLTGATVAYFKDTRGIDLILNFLRSNPDVLKSSTPEIAATAIADGVMDDAGKLDFFEYFVDQYESEIAAVVQAELSLQTQNAPAHVQD